MLLVFTSAAATRHRYYWANLLGSNVFNDMENWVDETFSASGNPYYYFPSAASGETVTMGADFTAYLFYFTNEVDVGTTTLDFNGQMLALTGKNHWTHYQNASPIVLKNGEFKPNATQRYAVFGREDGKPVEMRFERMIISANDFASADYAKTYGPCRFTFKDSFATNFPASLATTSDSEMTFDNSTYLAYAISFASQATNATMRFVNGAKWMTSNSAREWIKTGPGNANCRIIMSPGTKSNSKIVIEGTNNVLAVTNCVLSPVSVSGLGNLALLDNVDLEYTPAAGAGLSIGGTNSEIRLSGNLDGINMFRAWYGSGSKGARLVFDDNTVMTNYTSFAPFFQRAVDPVLSVGTNCYVKFHTLFMNAYEKTGGWHGVDSTNALIYVGRGSKVELVRIDYAGMGGALNGHNAKFVLDDGQLLYTGGKGSTVIYRGVTIEMKGDDAAFRAQGDGGSGDVPIRCGLDAGDRDEPTTLAYRPGPLAYHGVAPFWAKTLSSSYMTSNTVLKVDLSDYIPSQTTRHHLIPLIKGNPSKWATASDVAGKPKPDVEWLTKNLTIEPANDRVSNARIVYDADLDAISLAFELNFGLMILVR